MTFELARGVELTMGTGFTTPTRRRHARSPLWLNLLVGGEAARAYEAAALQVRAIPRPPRPSDIDRLIRDAYGKVVSGEAGGRAAMADVKPQVDAILAERGR